ncbi:MAG: beta-N-acetylglucosaminidase [Bacteroidia bacterium]|nr:MAG: beta-N-acetylglucosaminidase [Bacteroidia bacterium]
MKILYVILLTAIISIAGCKEGAENSINRYPLIPEPVTLTTMPGEFLIRESTRIVVSEKSDDVMLAAQYLSTLLTGSNGTDLQIIEATQPSARAINLVIGDIPQLNDEGYLLDISEKKIVITSRTAPGLFYGIQSIRQMLPPEVEAADFKPVYPLTLPACKIEDEPRFVYRGMHLDVGRHMFPVEYIKRYIDMLALHKMNTFHWHLTEDQGWRIEIMKYPLLTEIGSVRKETLIGHGGRPPFEFDGIEYGGYYTQNEVRDIVKYARDRFVTIIPEIELPGHSQAALAAYPEFSCTGGPHEVATQWGVFDEVYCAGKDETFGFLEDVLSEVIDLFPGTYIHIGGDECPKARWIECPDCQARIKAEGLADEHELQSYFIKRIEKYLSSRGRRLIGWDEILEGGLAPEATVMSWRGIDGGIAAARQGHDVIMTPNGQMYLDHYQCEPEGEPLAIGGYTPLEEVYGFEPLPAELSADEQKYILGVQGNLWSEYLKTPEYMEYMAYPRFFAVGEIGWTRADQKDFDDFVRRLKLQWPRYDIIGINYFKGEYYDTSR